MENVRNIDTLARLENPTVSSFIGTRYTIRKDAQPKMNYFNELLWQPGEEWTEIKGFAFLTGMVFSPWFSACYDNWTGLVFCSSQCQHQHCAPGMHFRQGFLPNSCLLSFSESITLYKSTGKSLCLSPGAKGSPVTSFWWSGTEVICTCTKGPCSWPSASHLFTRKWDQLLFAGTRRVNILLLDQGRLVCLLCDRNQTANAWF